MNFSLTFLVAGFVLAFFVFGLPVVRQIDVPRIVENATIQAMEEVL